MTREEARIELQAMKDTFEEYEPGGLRCQMALKVALSALRPVSREQVEKVFPGCALCNWGGLDFVGVDEDGIYLSKPVENEKFRFCPVCGKPLTDEAVEIVMERLEALHGETD